MRSGDRHRVAASSAVNALRAGPPPSAGRGNGPCAPQRLLEGCGLRDTWAQHTLNAHEGCEIARCSRRVRAAITATLAALGATVLGGRSGNAWRGGYTLGASAPFHRLCSVGNCGARRGADGYDRHSRPWPPAAYAAPAGDLSTPARKPGAPSLKTHAGLRHSNFRRPDAGTLVVPWHGLMSTAGRCSRRRRLLAPARPHLPVPAGRAPSSQDLAPACPFVSP